MSYHTSTVPIWIFYLLDTWCLSHVNKKQHNIWPLISDTCCKSDIYLLQVLSSKQMLRDHFPKPRYEIFLEVNDFTVKERQNSSWKFPKIKTYLHQEEFEISHHSFTSSTLSVDKAVLLVREVNRKNRSSEVSAVSSWIALRDHRKSAFNFIIITFLF